MSDSNQKIVEEKVRTQVAILGEFWDTIIKKDPDGKEVIVEVREWKKNLIVNTIGPLLAALMANESVQISGGIQWHAIGHGDASWDLGLPPANAADTTLYDEHYRKIPDSIVYLNDLNVVTPTMTHKIEITTTYDFSDSGADGSIREQGLFGGNATVSTDSGYMIDVIRHVEIFKDPTIKIIRKIRLSF